MLLLAALVLTFLTTALGLGVMQTAVMEATRVQQLMLTTQTFYTAETGLAIISHAVRSDFDAWEGAARDGWAPGPSGCFPVPGCGAMEPRRPAYATWAERMGEHVLHLIAIARAPGPATRAPCPIGGTGSVLEATLRRITTAPETYAYVLEQWRHTACPFSMP